MLLDRRRQYQSRAALDAPAAAPGGYVAQAVRFNGATSLSATSLTGMANGQKGILSFWIKMAGGDGSFRIIMESVDLDGHSLYVSNTNTLNFSLNNSVGTPVVIMLDHPTCDTATPWMHVVASWDLSGSGAISGYVNDVAVAMSMMAGQTIFYNTPNPNRVFGSRGGGALFLNADVADFYFNISESIDLTVTANRRKFISGTGGAVDLGATGSTPTGTAPILFFHGAVASWHVNDGTGGGFTVSTGSLSASPTNPP